MRFDHIPWEMSAVSGGTPSRSLPSPGPLDDARGGVVCRRGGGGGGERGRGVVLMLLAWIVLLSLPGVSMGRPVQEKGQEEYIPQQQTRDGCDRTVWSSKSERRAVHQLSVHCTEGTILWHQADGALRVLFNSHAPLQAGRELETCFSITSHLLKVVVSQDTGKEDMPPLVVLTKDIPRTAKDICIRSGTPVSLFLETQPGEPNMALGYVQLHYDVISVSKNEADSMEECRPCTDDELLLAVCSMDFVVEGQMTTVLQSSILEQSTIDIAVTKVYRQKNDYFKSPLEVEPSRLRRDLKLKQSEANQIPELDLESSHGMMYAPYKCGIRHGEGEFLFVGRMRLGRALLQCAPRVEEFKELWTQAVKDGLNPCTLD